MHTHILRNRGLALAIPGLIVAVAVGATPASAAGDEPGILGRFFRLGGSSSPSNAGRGRTTPAPAPNVLPYGGGAGPNASRGGNPQQKGNAGNAFIPPAAPRTPAPTPLAGPLGDGPSTPEVAETGSALPPVSPRPRVSDAVTNADPLLTRVALGRSTDGSQFGMFLQIFADGTLIDSEGVHRLSPADVKPIADLVASGDLGRNRGHCGSPSSDFIEDVQVIVYERRLGRLAAQPFSYSGNPQGCDHSVKHLHTLIEALQAKLSGQPAPTAHADAPTGTPAPGLATAEFPGGSAGPGSVSVDDGRPPLPSLAPTTPISPPSGAGTVIPLTPIGTP